MLFICRTQVNFSEIKIRVFDTRKIRYIVNINNFKRLSILKKEKKLEIKQVSTYFPAKSTLNLPYDRMVLSGRQISRDEAHIVPFQKRLNEERVKER